jgi:hypothetical protein
MISKEQLVKITERSILNLIKAYQKSPYLFYTESDLHAFLYNQVFNSMPFEQWLCNDSAKTESLLIHREYPTKERYSRKQLREGLEKGSRGHFDLTIWNPEITAERCIRAANQNFSEEQSTFIAIEFDLEEDNSPADFAIHHLRWDLMKLRSKKNEVEHGYLLVFSRDWVNKTAFLSQTKEYISEEEKVAILFIDSEEGIVPLSKKPFPSSF